jgi:hypothetical protein
MHERGLRGNDNPNRLIGEDHKTLFSAAAKAAARSGLQSGATSSTAPAISILTTLVKIARLPAPHSGL